MSVCIIYLASPRDAVIHPKNDLRRRFEALKYSVTRTRKLFPKFPIFIFHEDYTEEDKREIEYVTPTFIQVDFSGFDDVYQYVNASKGYMMMCRFFSGIVQKHPELQKFTHYIRLDDDSYLTDPYLTEKRIAGYMYYDYVYRSVFYEAKPQQSLFDFTISFLRRETKMNAIDFAVLRARLHMENFLITDRYSGKAPYNNFHFSSLRLWNHPFVAKYIQAIESVQGCLRYGWLDANIHAMIIWVLTKRISALRITTDTEFGYRHNVHISINNSLHVSVGDNLKFIPSDEEDTRPTPTVDLDLPGKLIFATFANTSYMDTERIQSQAREFGVFDEIHSCSENTIPEFIETHKDFIESQPNGYGLWIWKPKITLTLLESMEENDILVYCDAGVFLNRHGVLRLADYIQFLKDESTSIVAFSLNGDFKASNYACPDAVETYFPEFYDTPHQYCYAGVFMMKKTKDSVQLVEDWLQLCETYPYLNGESVKQHEDYRGGDADNGLFNLCLAKHDAIVYRVYPDETNIYFPGGDQFYKCPDWSQLKDFPFQIRRIRPVRTI